MHAPTLTRGRALVLASAAAVAVLGSAVLTAAAADGAPASDTTTRAAARSGDDVRTPLLVGEPLAPPAPAAPPPGPAPAPAPAAPPPAAEPAPTPADEVEAVSATVSISGTFERDGRTWVRYTGVQILYGDEARQLAAARGETLDTDFYVDRPMDDVFEVPLADDVEVLGSQRMGGAPELRAVPLSALAQAVAVGEPLIADVTIVDGVITRVAEVYFA